MTAAVIEKTAALSLGRARFVELHQTDGNLGHEAEKDDQYPLADMTVAAAELDTVDPVRSDLVESVQHFPAQRCIHPSGEFRGGER